MANQESAQEKKEHAESQGYYRRDVGKGIFLFLSATEKHDAQERQGKTSWKDKVGGWVRRGCNWMRRYSTVIIMLATVVNLIVAGLQWSTMTEETRANQVSAKAAEAQLMEMRTSSADTKAVAEAAKQSARVAEQTLVLSQRPWVATALALAGPFEFNQGDGRLRVKFTGVNVGNSVADGTEVFMEMSPLILSQENIGESMRRQKALCEKVKKERSQAQGRFGFALFPHEQMEWTSPVIMKKEDIDSVGARTDPRLPKNWVSPILVGCVIYRFTFSQEYHATGFIYQISRLIPNDPDAGGMIELNQTVPLTNLQMQPFSVGGSSRYAD